MILMFYEVVVLLNTANNISSSSPVSTFGLIVRGIWSHIYRFGDGYMITVRTKTTASVKEVIRFFNRNFPEAILKARVSFFIDIMTASLFLLYCYY